jgi:serine kinase of HPr protein (carbohydrate metabolism regulator)
VRRFNILYEDHVRVARTLSREDIFETIETLLRRHVAEAATRRVFIHAGAASWGGKVILIPGRSFSGKTTLVAELVRAGATYYSDEYAVLDSKGRVHPFSKPLSLRDNGETRQRSVDVEELGGRSGVKPLPVGLVVVAPYNAGSRWRPRRLTAGQGALALLANTVAARRQPAASLMAIKEAVGRATVLKGNRGEASEAVSSILGFCD